MRLTEERKQLFLQHYASSGLLYVAAEKAGISGFTVKSHMRDDPDFKARVEEALNRYRDVIEEEIHRRAIKGIMKPVFHQGIQCATVREFSDRLLELHAKRHIAGYRDKVTADVNMNGGVLVVPAKSKNDAEWEKDYANRPAKGDEAAATPESPSGS